MAYRILKYAISTKSIGIAYSNNGIKLKPYDPITKLPKERIINKNTLDVISDATWADDTENRKSQYGFLVLLNGNLISFKSKKLDNITLSTCETEFCALSVAHTLGIKNLLMELEMINIKINGVNDNISALQIASNGLRKIKHFELRYLFILEKIILGIMTLFDINTNNNLSDFLTKPLGRSYQISRFNLEINNLNELLYLTMRLKYFHFYTTLLWFPFKTNILFTKSYIYF